MSHGFPFLYLPYEVQRIVMENMKVVELMRFSLLSTRCSQIMRWMRPNVESISLHCSPHGSLFVKVSRDVEVVNVFLFTRPGDSYDFIHAIGDDFCPSHLPMSGGMVVAEVCGGKHEPTSYWFTDAAGNELLSRWMLDEVFRWCSGIFHHEERSVCLTPREFFLNISLFHTNPQLLSYTVRIQEDNGNVMSPLEMSFLLEAMGLRKLILEGFPSSDFFYNRPFRVHELVIKESAWVHFDSIFFMDTAVLILHEARAPTASHLNLMLKKWKAMEILHNLEMINLDIKSQPFSFRYIDEVLDDTGYFQTVAWAHGEPHIFIRRDDGLLASITSTVFAPFRMTIDRAPFPFCCHTMW